MVPLSNGTFQPRAALFLCLGFKRLQDVNSTAHASISACRPHCKDPRAMQIFRTEQKRGALFTTHASLTEPTKKDALSFARKSTCFRTNDTSAFRLNNLSVTYTQASRSVLPPGAEDAFARGFLRFTFQLTIGRLFGLHSGCSRSMLVVAFSAMSWMERVCGVNSQLKQPASWVVLRMSFLPTWPHPLFFPRELGGFLSFRQHPVGSLKMPHKHERDALSFPYTPADGTRMFPCSLARFFTCLPDLACVFAVWPVLGLTFSCGVWLWTLLLGRAERWLDYAEEDWVPRQAGH